MTGLKNIDYQWWVSIILSIVLSIVPFLITGGQKQLKIEDATSFKLTTLNSIKELDIKLFHNKKSITDLWIITHKLTNQGNIPILESDFQSSIEFEIDSNATILSTKILAKEPNHLPARISFEKNKFFIEPTLINPKEFIQYEVIFSSNNFVSIDAKPRIKGIHDILFQKKDYWRPTYNGILWPLGFISSIFGIVFFYILLQVPDYKYSLTNSFFKLKISIWEVCFLGILLFTAGTSLMDNGARYYKIYPSLEMRLLIFIPVYIIILLIIRKNLKKRMKNK